MDRVHSNVMKVDHSPAAPDEGSVRGAGLKVMRTEVSVLMLQETRCQVLRGADFSCHYHSASELSQLKGLLCHFGPDPQSAIRKTQGLTREAGRSIDPGSLLSACYFSDELLEKSDDHYLKDWV